MKEKISFIHKKILNMNINLIEKFVSFMRTGPQSTLTEQRVKYNELILKRLNSYLKKNPDIRFTQALHNLDIIVKNPPGKTGTSTPKDTYYEEPVVIWERVEKAYQKLK